MEKPVSFAFDDEINEAKIEMLVRAFYVRLRQNPELGPIFEQVIGDDWEPHLRKMFAFWSSVMLMSGRYKGQPVPVHKRLSNVRPEHFATWLKLFRETAREHFSAPAADMFIAKADRIAQSLQLAMFYNPAEVV